MELKSLSVCLRPAVKESKPVRCMQLTKTWFGKPVDTPHKIQENNETAAGTNFHEIKFLGNGSKAANGTQKRLN